MSLYSAIASSKLASPQNVWAQIQLAQGQDVPADPGKQGGTWDEHGSGSAGSGPTSPSEGGAP